MGAMSSAPSGSSKPSMLQSKRAPRPGGIDTSTPATLSTTVPVISKLRVPAMASSIRS